MAPSPQVPTVTEARAALRSVGLRATLCRVAVIQFLSVTESPTSHQEACSELEERGFDKSTIFRTLNDLADSGLAHRMELGDHVWRYELVPLQTTETTSNAPHPHPHLLCTTCGGITCLSAKQVQISVIKSLGEVSEILLKGHCRQCLQN